MNLKCLPVAARSSLSSAWCERPGNKPNLNQNWKDFSQELTKWTRNPQMFFYSQKIFAFICFWRGSWIQNFFLSISLFFHSKHRQEACKINPKKSKKRRWTDKNFSEHRHERRSWGKTEKLTFQSSSKKECGQIQTICSSLKCVKDSLNFIFGRQIFHTSKALHLYNHQYNYINTLLNIRQST